MTGSRFVTIRQLSTRSDVLAAVFVLYGLVSLLTLSFVTPPFQAPDEDAHLDRADQIAGGGLIGIRYAAISTSGGDMERAIFQAEQVFQPLQGHAERRLTRQMLDQAGSIAWTVRAAGSFPNTAVYPPFFYLPSTLGLLVGENAGLTVPHTLLLSRLAMGLLSTTLAAIAILCSGSAAPFLFTVFCLPMTLALFASVSQDGPMIACAGLACAMLLQAQRRSGRPARLAFLAACVAVGLVAMARPAYLPVALVMLLPGAVPIGMRAAGLAGISAVVLGWVMVARAFTLTTAVGAHVAAQLHAVAARPVLIERVLLHTFTTGNGLLIRQFIGVLGWLDTPLPDGFYVAAASLLALSLLAACPADAAWGDRPRRGGAVLCLLGAAAAVFVFQYLTWTAPGADAVGGVQGRYFIPVALFLPLALPRLRGGDRIRSVVMAGLSLFPCASLALAVRAVVYRYYL